MEVLYLLIPLAVGVMVVAIGFFLWTVRTGQYDDLEGPAHRILMDDDDPMIPDNAKTEQPAPPAGKARPRETAGDRKDGGAGDNLTD